MIPNKAKLFIVSGASGTGKTTLCRQLEKELGLFFSVSATTRFPRSGEVHGKDYYFLSDAEFDKMLDGNKFLEWASVYDHRYGTPKDPIEESLKKGKDVLLDLDTQGALHLKKSYPEAVLIFIKPPSLEALQQRLKGRATESAERMQQRIDRATHEIEESKNYDHIVLNRDLHEAKQELKKILQASHGGNSSP